MILRRLLQMDRPVARRDESEIAAEVERNYRWNFAVNLLDGASFWFGVSFISSATIVPLFISKLTDSQWAIGAAAMIAQGAWFLPQLFTANFVERLSRKKPVVVNLGFILERVPMWVIVGAALLAGRFPLAALVLFLLAYAWHGFGAGVVATAWQDLLARCFPVARRGRFFGTTLFVGTGAGAAAAGFSAWLLSEFPFPQNFVYNFAIAAFFITLSWAFLALVREPVQAPTAPAISNREYLRRLPDVLRRDENFRRYLLARMVLALGSLGVGFITVAAVRRWQLPDSVGGVFTAVLLLGQTVGNLGFGLLADRFGHKLSLEMSALAALAAFAVAWFAPTPAWYYVVFALAGVSTGAIIVSGVLVVMEFCAPEKRPTYAGLTNTGVGVVSMAAPLLGAWLASVSYDWLFAISAAVNLVAFLLMRFWVREPRHAAALVAAGELGD